MNQMHDLWISAPILALERTITERVLLARICQQAARGGGSCNDSNKDLAQAIGMHQQTVSDTVNRLSNDGLIQSQTISSQANRRTLTPSDTLISDYKEFTDSLNSGAVALGKPYKFKAYRRKLEPAIRETRLCPVTGVDITHQRASSVVINNTTVKALFKQDQNRFNELVARLLPAHMATEGYGTRCNALTWTARKLAKANLHQPK